MSHPLIESIYNHLLTVIPGSEPVSRESFSAAEIPAVVAHFLTHVLDRRVETEDDRLKTIGGLWVDHEREELRIGRTAFLSLMQRYAAFPVDEWPRALHQAVQITCAHLVRPVPTLIQFVFGDRDERRPVDVVRRRARYFLAAPHLRSAIDAFVEHRGSEAIERGALEDALGAVDRRMSADYTTDDWIRALAPLFALAQSAGGRGVPIDLVASFFEEKGATDTAARVSSFTKQSGLAALDQDTLSAALHFVEPKEEPVKEPDPEAEAPKEPTVAPGPTHHPIAMSPAPRAKDLPLWRRFQSTTASPVAEAESATPLWKKFQRHGADTAPVATTAVVQPQHVSEPKAPTSIEALEQVVLGDSNDRDRFVSALFDGSSEAYRGVLARLHDAPDWTAAQQILARDIFRAFRVDIYSDEAVAFTEAVEARFNPTGAARRP